MTCMTHIRLFYHPSIIMEWSALPCRVQHSQPCWLHLSLLVHMHCTLHVYLYSGQCGHRVAHKTCVNDTKKCRTLTAFSLRLCPDMQVASRKIILSHNIIITLCVSLMKKWVSACFLRRGGGKLRIDSIRNLKFLNFFNFKLTARQSCWFRKNCLGLKQLSFASRKQTKQQRLLG